MNQTKPLKPLVFEWEPPFVQPFRDALKAFDLVSCDETENPNGTTTFTVVMKTLNDAWNLGGATIDLHRQQVAKRRKK
jgi:hypothetical protein